MSEVLGSISGVESSGFNVDAGVVLTALAAFILGDVPFFVVVVCLASVWPSPVFLFPSIAIFSATVGIVWPVKYTP